MIFTLRHQDSSNIYDLVNLYPAYPGSGNIYELHSSSIVYAIQDGIARKKEKLHVKVL
jgi:hypothetical protein